jgi:hypothetical protein
MRLYIAFSEQLSINRPMVESCGPIDRTAIRTPRPIPVYEVASCEAAH